MHSLKVIFIALISSWLAGCGQKQEAPSATRTEQNENRRPPIAVNNLRQPSEGPGSRLPRQMVIPASEQLQNSKLPLYELKIDPQDLTALERNPFSGETHPGTFTFDGKVYDPVQVRFRGQWARSWPKKPIKIFFNRDKPFQEHHSLNLNSGWRDPAFVRETLAYHIYAVCGVPASRSRMVRLHVNDQFRGLYVEVEQVDKAFLRRFKLDGASLFKTSGHADQSDERDLGSETSFAAHYENETQKTNGIRQLQLFCHDLAVSTNTLDFFTRRVDLEKYINYLAATVLVQHWDCFNKNHFLVYDERGSKKWFVVPWDLDRTLGDHWNWSFGSADLPILLGTRKAPGVTGWNRLQDRFLAEPTLRTRFLNRLEELLEKAFTTEKLVPIIDRLESEIAPEAALDRQQWPGPAGDLKSGISELKRYIERRRAFLKNEIKSLR
ncbi:MAG: hypothetical protein EXS31_05595 [Pedosphaera sp.]|nr:hypothetical protein [Pedosphaera sp.]